MHTHTQKVLLRNGHWLSQKKISNLLESTWCNDHRYAYNGYKIKTIFLVHHNVFRWMNSNIRTFSNVLVSNIVRTSMTSNTLRESFAQIWSLTISEKLKALPIYGNWSSQRSSPRYYNNLHDVMIIDTPIIGIRWQTHIMRITLSFDEWILCKCTGVEHSKNKNHLHTGKR